MGSPDSEAVRVKGELVGSPDSEAIRVCSGEGGVGGFT